MSPVHVPNYTKWSRPPTSVYEGNYGFGINFYQPMIEYITQKEQGASPRPPHLPWSDERALEKYRTDKPVRPYSDMEVARVTRETAEHANKYLHTADAFQVAKRSPTSVCAMAVAGNLGKHLSVDGAMVNSNRKKIDKEKIKMERQKKRMIEIEKELRTYEAEVNTGAELKRKASKYRGKSAAAIAQTLLTESRDKVEREVRTDIQTSTTKHDTRDTHVTFKVSQNVRNVRASSPCMTVFELTTEDQASGNSYLKPLQEIKRTLKQLDHINTSFILDKR